MRFRGGSGIDADKATGLQDFVEGFALYHQVFDDRERRTAPRFYRYGATVGEAPHVQLTGGNVVVRTVGPSVDVQAARPANAFAAIVVKSNRLFTLCNQVVVHDIEHFQKRRIGRNTIYINSLEISFGFGRGLPPYVQCKMHALCISRYTFVLPA